MALFIQTVFDGTSDYTIRTRLDGKDYNLRFLWNQREGRWYLTIADDAETIILAGIKLVTNWMLLRAYQAEDAVPPGEFIVIDLSPDGSPAGLTELGVGRRCTLTYFSADPG